LPGRYMLLEEKEKINEGGYSLQVWLHWTEICA